MSAYIGTYGRLVPLWTTPTMEISQDPQYKISKTVEGIAKAQRVPSPSRQWELDGSGATPAERGTLAGFALGEWGPGPFLWVPPDAPSTNLLTPATARCDTAENPSSIILPGGPMPQPDGTWSGQSYLVPNTTLVVFFGRNRPGQTTAGERIPVIPGETITAGATLAGTTATIELQFYDATDTWISTARSPVTGTETKVATVTTQAPKNAVAARIFARNTTQASRPFATWTKKPHGWAQGAGCVSAIIEDHSATAVRASRIFEQSNWYETSFTITEVG